ncbi:DUF554 domain-containing protein [Lysinibacillus sp. 2017]|uniref:DUF554 domain-containing protein n=1 Tax=unclassified Lysinibacillus TaxID=2636778 RepID=UPI000D52921B|nr:MULTISPECIES: DUF554 domain-containing protein [unclassified Lysinibacillus]AWE09176.1 DUF554 domain-containing protein [Lysinibacillus sp. 2017]TGN36002.1 DUF554 domain-containing protein [Lysinibacillus sp. S2017]
MVLLGSFLNALFIVIGALLGRLFKNIPESMQQTVMSIIGLVVAVLGIQMGITSSNFIIIVSSLVIGTVIGEWLDLEGKFNRFGKWIESLFGKKAKQGTIAEGFVTATLIFVIGSMAIIGALDSGLRNDHDVLITKGIIDGFLAIILASTLGIGVLLSAVVVFLYQGAIALFAGVISTYIPQEALDLFITEMTATGGVMILAIGLNITGLTKIRVANLLPAIVMVGIIVTILFSFQ